MKAVYQHTLKGCRPTPLASYLKSLAVLRLITEQAGDVDAAVSWRNGILVLRTYLSKDEVCRFFLEDYRPMVILSPWNGRAGFLEGEDAEGSTRKGPQLISRLMESTGVRFAEYRELIARVRTLPEIVELNRARSRLKDLDRLKKSGVLVDEQERKELSERTKNSKTNLLVSLRSRMPERFVDWIDACLTLGTNRLFAAPLLGSGGNEGSMDLSINHIGLLLELIDPDSDEPAPEAASLLNEALFALPTPLWSGVNLGQLSPGRVGGPNMSTGFSGWLSENPWSAVLALEGAASFHASTTKRLDSSFDPALSFPFLVDAVLAGAGGVGSDESARPEIWLPLWDAFATYSEVKCLIREGRLTMGRRQATSALDAARSVATLGVDRGISTFQRYGIFERRGRGYYVTTPLGSFWVRGNRNKVVDLISELDANGWLKRLQAATRASEAPASLRTLAAQLSSALFAMSQQSSRMAVERVLRLLGRIERLCANSVKVRDFLELPVPTLSSEWVWAADDQSADFRIALALSGLSLLGQSDERSVRLTMRSHLTPIAPNGCSWDSKSHLACWGAGALERNLFQVLHQRRLEAARMGAENETLHSWTGAGLGDIWKFLFHRTDDQRLGELLCGLACANLERLTPPQKISRAAVLPAFAVLKPFFTSESMLRRALVHERIWLPADHSLGLPPEIPARLVAGDIHAALALAWRRLRAVGVRLPGSDPPNAVGVSGPRLLAALMVPLTIVETSRVLEWLEFVPDAEVLERAIPG